MKKITFLKYIEIINEEFDEIIKIYKKLFVFRMGEKGETNYEEAIKKLEYLNEKAKGKYFVLPSYEDLSRFYHVNKSLFKKDRMYLTNERKVGMEIVGNKTLEVFCPPYIPVYTFFQEKRSIGYYKNFIKVNKAFNKVLKKLKK